MLDVDGNPVDAAIVSISNPPNDRRQKIKLWGAYRLNDNFSLIADLLSQSGWPRNAFGTQHPDGQFFCTATGYLRFGVAMRFQSSAASALT